MDIQRNELNRYIEVHQKARELEISSEMINEQISLVQEELTTAIMNDPDNEDQIEDIYNARLNHLYIMFLINCFYNFLTEYAIQDLTGCLRLHWPDVNITPKIHMLEDHAADFIKKWGVCLGFYGE